MQFFDISAETRDYSWIEFLSFHRSAWNAVCTLCVHYLKECRALERGIINNELKKGLSYTIIYCHLLSSPIMKNEKRVLNGVKWGHFGISNMIKKLRIPAFVRLR